MDWITEDSAFSTLMVFYVAYIAVLYIILLVFGVISYILNGISLSAIARRRGIEKPWLAWVPVGVVWLLGCISDQYRYVAHNQETNRRGKLLTLSIVGLIGGVIISVASALTTYGQTVGAVGSSGTLLLLLLVYGFLAVMAVSSVLQYMAYFDLFRSCDPGKSLVYLLVSIFAGFPLPFFVYSCRNKDLGMPPRTEVPQLPCE